MAPIAQDLRYAFRTLRKAPLFSAVAVLSLAFGIGANTAIFTLIHQLILRRLPVRDPQQLVMLAGRGRHYGGNNGRDKISYPMYQDIRDKNQVFDGMFATHRETMSASFEDRTELIAGELVSGNYFRVLGIGAALGRVLTGADDRYQGGHPLAVLSYGYWKSAVRRRPRHPRKENHREWIPAHRDRRQPGGFRRRGARICAAGSRADYHDQQSAAGRNVRPSQQPPFSVDGGLRAAEAWYDARKSAGRPTAACSTRFSRWKCSRRSLPKRRPS